MLDLVPELLAAIGAGILLNLTPCVLPVMPIKIRTIIRHAGETRPRRIAAAAAFFGGTLLFFTSLGLISSLLHLTWGAIFQSRLVLAALTIILAASAVAMFADVAIPIPSVLYRVGGGSFLEPFSSGVLAAVLATPCTGPFLGGILAFSLTQPPAIVIGLFLAIGTGLALPYVVLLLRPGLLDRIPRGGEWSQRIHQALAFVLCAGAAFFAQSLVPAILGLWLWRFWAAFLVVWALGTIWRGRSRSGRMVAAIFTIAAISTAYAGGLFVSERTGPLDWQPFSASRFVAANHDNLPVLIEFTAAWCINCKILEQTVYAEHTVANAARRAQLVPLRVDLTTPDKPMERMLIRDGGAGLPFAVMFDGRGQIVERFSGLFTARDLIMAIRRTGSIKLPEIGRNAA